MFPIKWFHLLSRSKEHSSRDRRKRNNIMYVYVQDSLRNPVELRGKINQKINLSKIVCARWKETYVLWLCSINVNTNGAGALIM